jgi:Domain of unknown function (DUF1918)
MRDGDMLAAPERREENVTTTKMKRAAAGDRVEVGSRHVGEPGRKGRILEVLGDEQRPHYLVRWEDGHESVLYPSEATIVHARGRAGSP